MGLGPIPWTAMVMWCDYHRLPREVADHLCRVVATVDGMIITKANATPPKTTPRKGR